MRQTLYPINQAGWTVRDVCDWLLPDAGVERTLVLTDHSLWGFAYAGDPLTVTTVVRTSLLQFADVEIVEADVGKHEGQTLAFLWDQSRKPTLLASGNREAPQFAATRQTRSTTAQHIRPNSLPTSCADR